MSSQSQSPLQFGDPRPTSHVTNHTTFGLASRTPSLDYTGSDARELLQNVKDDDESERKRSGTIRAFGRRFPSQSESSHQEDTHSTDKHLVKMGIFMPEDANASFSLRGTQSTGGANLLRKTQTLPVSSPRGRLSGANVCTEEVLPKGARPVTRPRADSSGFELVEAEPGEENAITQPSPPISVKSSSSSNNTLGGGIGDELQPSSPDSGYGNTPDYVNASRSEDKDKRERGSTNNSVYSVGSVSGSPRRSVEPIDRPTLRHTHSVPVNMAHTVEGGLERGTTFPFQMSLATNRSAVDFGEMEERLQMSARHHLTPAQPTPHQKAKGQSDVSPNAQRPRVWRKNRATSQPHTAANTVSPRPPKAGTLPPTLSNTKDYFQVTDELAKENAHFALSEALLNVIEQYKANCIEQSAEEPVSPTSSPVVPNKPWKWSPGALTPIGGAHYLGEHIEAESPVGSPTTVLTSFGGEVTTGDTHTSPRRSRHLSLLELVESPSSDNSAESTAQRLLRHMTGHMTLEGMDGSQVVVQLPTEFLTSLRNDEDLQRSVTTSSAHIRGNRDWAPPRKQIIYSVKQPSKNLHKDLAAQGFRCTGCGMKVAPAYAKFFRFCHYTGKYFCQNCHTNATSLIPAHILDRWSFKKLPVSNFARDLLAKIHSDAVFTISSESTFLYNKVSVMSQAKDIRAQLIAVKRYLHTCKSDEAQHLNRSFQGYAPWTTDLHTYSIEDFLEVKGGSKMKYLRAMLGDGVVHVKNCPVCMGKGFVCELCSSQDIIYPFESSKVNVCPECQCCFHKNCFPPSTPCPRCERLNQRSRQRARFEDSKQTLRSYSNRHS